MPKIVADSKIPFLRGVLEPFAEVRHLPAAQLTREAIMDADALIIRTRTHCNEALLAGTRVKYIATATIGHDHIDAEYCKKAGIRWSNAPGCNAGSVMQYVASALALIAEHDQKSFGDYVLGIIGAGHVGKKVAGLASALGMRVLINDPPRERMEGKQGFVDLETLLAKADMVSMHMPLYYTGPDKSHHMADAAFFSRMKRGAWFINTARGEVADTRALTDALLRERIRGAVLDVWESEPGIDIELLQAATIGTPHIAGYSADGKAMGTAMAVRAVSRFFGLGLDTWFPETLPEPENPVIHADPNSQDPTHIMRRLFLHTYDIHHDSELLKAHPERFELFRDEYPPRREFQAYTVRTGSCGSVVLKTISQTGFRLA
ncbi:MAG: 4-phosphoerythronate dehydrogenase PdxB [Bacteroidales bacterium]|nr:4-phosphoerythronate dehydrogenase PdxB [Bacteroidales bacterium]